MRFLLCFTGFRFWKHLHTFKIRFYLIGVSNNVCNWSCTARCWIYLKIGTWIESPYTRSDTFGARNLRPFCEVHRRILLDDYHADKIAKSSAIKYTKRKYLNEKFSFILIMLKHFHFNFLFLQTNPAFSTRQLHNKRNFELEWKNARNYQYQKWTWWHRKTSIISIEQFEDDV